MREKPILSKIQDTKKYRTLQEIQDRYDHCRMLQETIKTKNQNNYLLLIQPFEN